MASFYFRSTESLTAARCFTFFIILLFSTSSSNHLTAPVSGKVRLKSWYRQGQGISACEARFKQIQSHNPSLGYIESRYFRPSYARSPHDAASRRCSPHELDLPTRSLSSRRCSPHGLHVPRGSTSLRARSLQGAAVLMGSTSLRPPPAFCF
jgi:hypothetical protein